MLNRAGEIVREHLSLDCEPNGFLSQRDALTKLYLQYIGHES